MRPAEAEHIAQLIHRSWKNTSHLTLEVWAEELFDLDAGTAGTTLVQLRRTRDRPPSIAEFRTHYRSLSTDATDPTETAWCPTCDGDGWIEAPPIVRGENTTTAVEPCPTRGCTAGEAARRTYIRINAARRDDERPEAPPTNGAEMRAVADRARRRAAADRAAADELPF